MNRTRDYYRKQRKRVIKKKRAHMAGSWFAMDKPAGVFAKNKFHCPIHSRQTKTTPKAVAYRYGDRKHNWKPHDAREINRINEQILDLGYTDEPSEI